MASLLETLQGQIGEGEIRKLSRALGSDEERVQGAVAGALPMLVSALARNAEDPRQAKSLTRALERDHDGSVLDRVGDFLGRGDTGDGSGILGHVLGERRPAAQRGLAQVSGLDEGKAGDLMALLAPVVMGALGKIQRQRSMAAGDVSDLLGREREALRSRGGGQDLLTSILDADGDGQVMDDALEAGMGLLGSFLNKRR